MKDLKKLYTPQMQQAARIAASDTTGKDFWEEFAKQIPRDKPVVTPRKIKDS